MDNTIKHVQITQKENIRILQLTDIHHFSKSTKTFTSGAITIDLENSVYDTEKNIEAVKVLLDQTNPDLVVLTGDIIDGRAFSENEKDGWKSAMMEIINPLIKRNIKWTFVPGNHDDDHAPWKREELLGIYSLPNCASENISTWDHSITIGNDSNSPEDCVRLWLFDSGTNSPDPKLKYTTFDSKVVKDFQNYSGCNDEEENNHKVIWPKCGAEMAMFHIPLPEYRYSKEIVGTLGLFDAALKAGSVPSPWCYIPNFVKLIGKHRVCGCSEINSGIFSSFVSSKRICATFCGHDHFNDAVMERDGIFMCYGRVCSFSPPSNWEGKAGKLPFDCGGRVIEFNLKNKSVFTWVEGVGTGEEKGSRIMIQSFKNQQNNNNKSSVVAVDNNKFTSNFLFFFLVFCFVLIIIRNDFFSFFPKKLII